MKVTVQTILDANVALQMMQINGGIPFKIVRMLRKLKDTLLDEVTIAKERQAKIIEDYGGVIQDNQTLIFPDADKRKAFERDLHELLNTEIELEASRIDLTEFGDNIIFQSINADIDALSAFIIFDQE